MEALEQRVCTRCLLREMIAADSAKKAEMEMIERYRDAIKPVDRVSGEEYERRLALCQGCEKLFAGTCAACGCYVELRAAAAVSHCPRGKW